MYVEVTRIENEWCFEFKNMTENQVKLLRIALADMKETTMPHVSSSDRELAEVMMKRIDQTLIK